MSTKRMKLKTRKKKFSKIKLLFYLSFIYISFAYTFYYYFNSKKIVSNEEFINLLVTTGNANILNEYKMTNVIGKTMNILFEIDFNKPSSLLNSSILKFGDIKDEETKTISLEYNDDYSNMDELKDVSDYISDPNPKEESNPLIYIYNTHQLENYSNKDLDIYGITPNVLMASYVLRERLNEMGISSIVEEANISNLLKKNNWNYSYSYQVTKELIKEKMNKYSSLKYFIDLHRDSITREYSVATINGKSYAKVMFVIGTNHDNWQANYKLSNDLNELIKKYYPGLSRNIMKKTGTGVNGIYNQNLSPNCILIEVGGVDNTIEEVYNTIDALTDIIFKYLKEKGEIK